MHASCARMNLIGPRTLCQRSWVCDYHIWWDRSSVNQSLN